MDLAKLQLDDADNRPGSSRAFVVVRRGGRWTDLLRLSAERNALIGRASSNQIVIRSHQASRHHAEIRWDNGEWWVRDLGSRNGTIVNGKRIEIAEKLGEGSCIEVAGCAMTFISHMTNALQSSTLNDPSTRIRRNAVAQLSDEQLTIENLMGKPDGDPGSHDEIMHQSKESRFLDASMNVADGAPSLANAAWQLLFGLAFRLASAESIEDAAQMTVKTLSSAVKASACGVFLPAARKSVPASPASPSTSAIPTSDVALTLVAFINQENRSYRPPALTIIQSVASNGVAVVVRNLVDDIELQDADSRGEYSTSCAILAPIALKSTDAAGQNQFGFLHLYTTDIAVDYSIVELELTIAAAGVLAAAIENLRTRGKLTRSLRQSRHQIRQLREQLEGSLQIVGNSPAIEHVKSMIARVARTNTTVLVRGESGVGKELVVAAIHQSSSRQLAPMVCLNCAALSPTLLESELFGHEKGAFTGATEQKKGKFEVADGGTLMLDEIGEMSIDLQSKLLRVLEGHSFERLGGHVPIKVDVRIVAATNRDLAAEVQRGRFRADLFYRLNVVEIVVPPLRERREDILPIAQHFLARFADKSARAVDGFTTRATNLLLSHRWPGNIRELKNVIERAVVLGCDDTIDVSDLNIILDNENVAPARDTASDENSTALSQEVSSPSKIGKTLASLNAVEQQHLIAVLRDVGGNKSRASIVLGIERSTLDRKLKRFGIKPSQYQ